jgi:hypothetical protein
MREARIERMREARMVLLGGPQSLMNLDLLV